MDFSPLSEEVWLMIPHDARPQTMDDTKGIVAWMGSEVWAVAIMDSWTKNSCRIHVTLFNRFALKHGFQQEVFNFIFNTGGRKLVIGSTPSDNTKALKFNAHMGFREVYRIKDCFEDGVDAVITEMRKEECRWIRQDKEVANG